MLISLMMKAGWQLIFSLNLESKQRNGTDDRKQDISPSKNQRERKIAPTWHVCSSCFLFPFYLTPESKLRQLMRWIFVCFFFFQYRKNVALKIHERNVSSASFRKVLYCKRIGIASVDMFCCFWVRFRHKNVFLCSSRWSWNEQNSESPM